MADMTSLIVDSILALLLIAAIVACFLVYKRLSTIREGQDELKSLVDSLNVAIIEAQKSVRYLKNSSTEIEDILKLEVHKGRALADELAVIVEAGNNLADRIETRLTGQGKVHAAYVAQEEEPKQNEQQKALLEALREAR